jgi:uncharacterized tellurite resistance protein B-like protein
VFFGNLFKADEPQQVPPRITSAEHLRDAVKAHLPEADDEAVAFVTALAGLLATIAYADRDYSSVEQLHVRQALSQVPDLTPLGIEAVAYDVTLRREILDCLVDLAATDGTLSLAETNLLRRTTAALGLEPNDYIVSQDRHRDKLKHD